MSQGEQRLSMDLVIQGSQVFLNGASVSPNDLASWAVLAAMAPVESFTSPGVKAAIYQARARTRVSQADYELDIR